MKSYVQYIFIIILLSSFSFSLNTINKYEEADKVKHISINTFERDIDKIYKDISKKNIFNATNCIKYISTITDFLLIQSGEKFLPFTQKDFTILQKRGGIILNKLFLLRLRLRQKLKEFYLQGNITPNCVKKIRMAFRYSRFIEEFITEIMVNMAQEPIKANKKDFSQKEYQFYLNPKYKNFTIKSGDILLLRSSSFVSAIIARIGDEAGQFSHGAMIHVDKNGKTYVIESLISSGTIITPYEKWRKINHHSRALLFRHNDETLAKKSALKIYNTIKALKASNDLILYDFTMNDSDNNQIFCAELIGYAFKLEGNHQIPTYRTSLKAFNNHTFLNELGISTQEIFSPGDLEIEPFINLVAEWRDYDTTGLSRLQDVIQTKVLQWMSHKQYYLKDTFKSSFGATLGLIGRRLFGLNSKNISPNMPYNFIENIIKLYDLSERLEKYLLTLEKEYLKKHGHPMDYHTMIKEMEKFRIQDCEAYRERHKEMIQKLYDIETLSEPYKSPKPIFHDIFNTKNELECHL